MILIMNKSIFFSFSEQIKTKIKVFGVMLAGVQGVGSAFADTGGLSMIADRSAPATQGQRNKLLSRKIFSLMDFVHESA